MLRQVFTFPGFGQELNDSCTRRIISSQSAKCLRFNDPGACLDPGTNPIGSRQFTTAERKTGKAKSLNLINFF